MNLFCIAALFSILNNSFKAWGQSTPQADYEAVALQYFLDTLLPQDHPTYHKVTYSGYISPVPFTFQIFTPCFITLDSLKDEESSGTLVIQAQPTKKEVRASPNNSLKVVKQTSRNIPVVAIGDALELRGRHVVPIWLSLRHQYADCYYITLNMTGYVIASCRKSTIQ